MRKAVKALTPSDYFDVWNRRTLHNLRANVQALDGSDERRGQIGSFSPPEPLIQESEFTSHLWRELQKIGNGSCTVSPTAGGYETVRKLDDLSAVCSFPSHRTWRSYLPESINPPLSALCEAATMWTLPWSQPTLTERAWSTLPFTTQPTLLSRTTSALLSPLSLLRSTTELFRTLPALSLLIPFLTSYSTSLNLLFFYLTWSTLLLSNSPLKVEIIGTLAIRIVFYVLPALGFYAFDALMPSLSVGVKEHGEVALVLSEEHGGKRGGRWWRVPGVSVGNVVLGVALQSGVEYLFTEVLRVRSVLKVTTALPMPWGIFVDLLRGFVLREVLTYTIHVYLHNPHFPPSRYHTKTYHSLPALYSFTAHYDHPIPYLLLRWLPTYLPALLWRFHLLTYFLYLSIISLEETFAYSGYNVLPSAFVVGGIARRHEIHLMGGGEGNFGCWGVCDFVMGTSLGKDVLEDTKDEAEKQNAAGKAKGKARGAARKRRGGRE